MFHQIRYLSGPVSSDLLRHVTGFSIYMLSSKPSTCPMVALSQVTMAANQIPPEYCDAAWICLSRFYSEPTPTKHVEHFYPRLKLLAGTSSTRVGARSGYGKLPVPRQAGQRSVISALGRLILRLDALMPNYSGLNNVGHVRFSPDLGGHSITHRLIICRMTIYQDRQNLVKLLSHGIPR